MSSLQTDGEGRRKGEDDVYERKLERDGKKGWEYWSGVCMCCDTELLILCVINESIVKKLS